MTGYILFDANGNKVGTVTPYGGPNWGGLHFSPAGTGSRKPKQVEGATEPRQALPGWAQKIVTRIESYTY